MADASYTAWDDNLYEWPPPDGWYEASDGKWWPDGYGPGPVDSAPGSAGEPPAVPDTALASPDDARNGSNGDNSGGDDDAGGDDELPNIDDVFGGIDPFSDDEPPARRIPDGPVAIDDLLPPDDGGDDVGDDGGGVDAAADAGTPSEFPPGQVASDHFAPSVEPDHFTLSDAMPDAPSDSMPDVIPDRIDLSGDLDLDREALSFDQLAPDLVEPEPEPEPEPAGHFDSPVFGSGDAFDRRYADHESEPEPELEPEPVFAQAAARRTYEAEADPELDPVDPEASARNVLDRHRSPSVAAQPATAASSAPSIRRESSRGVGRAIWPLLLAGACLALVAALVLAFFVNRSGGDDNVNPGPGTTAGRGSFDQPWSLGTGVVVFYNDDVTEQERRWVIQVLAPASNGTERFVTNGGATPPPDGEILAFTRARVTYQSGPAPGSLTDLTLDAAGPTGETYTIEANGCDGVVDAIDLTGDLDVSGSVEGNICWRIPAGDLSGLRLAVRADPAEGIVHLLLS